MTCEAKPDMEIIASIPATGKVPFLSGDMPPPLTCYPRPGNDTTTSGYWDELNQIHVNDTSYPNAAGRTDVEGCCWFGRGILSTRGSCNLGKASFHLTGTTGLYPDQNFCEYFATYHPNFVPRIIAQRSSLFHIRKAPIQKLFVPAKRRWK